MGSSVLRSCHVMHISCEKLIMRIERSSLMLNRVTTLMKAQDVACTMASRAKRKRENQTLQSLLGDKSLSLETLRRILPQLSAGETPIGTHHQLLTTYKERLQHVLVTEVLFDKKGNEVKWDLCCPSRLLQYVLDLCPELQSIYARAANDHRGEWNCVIEFDEFVPGDKLKTHNYRKTMTLCFSFLELGRRALVLPACWMMPVIVRSALYMEVEGGWSNFLRIFMHRMFLGPLGLGTAGVPLMLFGAPFLLRATLSNLLSDGDGLRAALNWRGANSLRPCLRHWNVTKRGSAILEHSADLVDVTCADHRLFKKQSDADTSADLALVEAAARRRALAEGAIDRITATMLDNICASRGVKYHARGIMFDPLVRPLITQRVITIDWVHTFLCDGVLSVEVRLLLDSSEAKLGRSWANLAAFLEGWSFPRDKRVEMRVLHRIFDDFRQSYAEEHSKIKACASELLCAYGLVRQWVVVELHGEASMAMEVDSFNCCCETIDVILSTKRGSLTMARGSSLLRKAHQRHLGRHVLVYGTENIKPKHHWPFDIAEQWLEHKLVLDAFLIEKEHLRAKAFADRVQNTSSYEQSVLAGVLNSQVTSLQKLGPHQELLGISAPFPGFPDARVADNLCINGVVASVGDFVFLAAKVGRVAACISEGDDFFFVVDALALVARIADHSGNYALQDQRLVWNASEARVSLAWREIAPSCFTVILY